MTQTPDPEAQSPGRPGETEKERLDRNLQDLLAGLRVALPGVQVLFAFLLVLPFQARFGDVTEFQEKTYYVTLLATAMASVLLIAPSARHRERFRKDDKHWVVVTGNRLGIAGLAFLGLAMTGAILLVADFLFSIELAIVSAIAVGGVIAWTWFVSARLRA